MATFENTNNQVQIIRWYSVDNDDDNDVEALPNGVHTNIKLMPYAAKFTFKDGDLSDISVYGKVVKKDGSLSDRKMQIPALYSWNRIEWPVWLFKLDKLARAEFAEVLRTNRVVATLAQF